MVIQNSHCSISSLYILTSSLDTDKFGNETVLEYTKKYLDIGERAFDYTSAWFGSSEFFKRK